MLAIFFGPNVDDVERAFNKAEGKHSTLRYVTCGYRWGHFRLNTESGVYVTYAWKAYLLMPASLVLLFVIIAAAS